MNTHRLDTMLLTVLLALALGGCQRHTADEGATYGYSDDYLQARQTFTDAVPASTAMVDDFVAFYHPLDEQKIRTQLHQRYASQLYFNDSLSTLHSREALEKHLLATAKRLSQLEITLLRVIMDGNDAYLCWVMDAQFSVLGKSRRSQTIGISQLRFNRQGQVIFQQDFWDSSLGVDQHLPVIGAIVRWLRDY